MSTCGSSSIRVFSGAPDLIQRNQPGASLPRAPIIERRHYTYCRASLHKSYPLSAAISSPFAPPSIQRVGRESMGKSEIIARAEELVKSAMGGNDASHDAAHAFRVRDLALSLAREEGFSSSPDSILIVELAALLHDIGDYKYMSSKFYEGIDIFSLPLDLVSDQLFPVFNIIKSRDPSEGKIVEDFLVNERVDESIKSRILGIIKGIGFKEEVAGIAGGTQYPEFGVVQDADRLDAIGAIEVKSWYPTYYIMFHPQSGQCVQIDKGNNRAFLANCKNASPWAQHQDGGPIMLQDRTSWCLEMAGDGETARVSYDCSTKWKVASSIGLQLATRVKHGKYKCLEKHINNSALVTSKCFCVNNNLHDLPTCPYNPQGQWFKFVPRNIYNYI